MATVQIYNSWVSYDRQPSPGYMTIGKNSSGTNRWGIVGFPAINVPGIITEVRLYMPWNNSEAGEGFSASTTHQATIGGNVYDYPISGGSGTAQVVLAAGWSIEAPFEVDLRGKSSNSNSTSKGYSQSPYLIVTYTPITAPTAPTNPACAPNPFETALRLSWTKGSNGTNNPITGHEVRYQTSDNGTSWSSETVINVGASTLYYDIPAATIAGWSRGKYVRFRVGSVSQYSDTVYSGYSSSVRKNRAPTASPSNLVASPENYIGGNVTITFAAGADPDNNIAGYHFQYSESPDAINWGSWADTTDATTSPKITVLSSDGAAGKYYRFRARTYDQFGVTSAWSNPSNSVLFGLSLKVKIAGDLKSIAEGKVLVNGALKQVSEIKVLMDGVLKNLTT